MQNPDFVRNAFSAIASRYVATNHVLSLGIDFLWRARVAQRVCEWKPQNLLDIATGTGDLALALQAACPEMEITGSDFCPPMLEVARQRGLKHLVEADALNLPFENESYECVTVAFGLRNMASYPKAIAEMYRVLRPGGHLVILDFSLPSPPLKAPYRWYLHRILPTIGSWMTGHKDAYAYLGQSIEDFPAGKALCQLLEEGGFCEAEFEPLSLGIASLYVAYKAHG